MGKNKKDRTDSVQVGRRQQNTCILTYIHRGYSAFRFHLMIYYVHVCRYEVDKVSRLFFSN